MKIDHKSYLGLVLNSPQFCAGMANKSKEYAQSDVLLNHILGAFSPEDAFAQHETIENLLNQVYNRSMPSFLVTKTAKEVIDNISVTDKFDLSILGQIHRRGGNILFSTDKSFRYEIASGFIFIVAVNRLGGKWSSELEDYIDLIPLAGGFLFGNPTQEAIEWRRLVFQTILFIELTDPELVFVPPGKKFASSPMGYSNNGPTGVTIVRSTWNKFIIRTEGFSVSGHFRAQRHGEKRAEVKLIWIQPFQKHGYVRRPKSANE